MISRKVFVTALLVFTLQILFRYRPRRKVDAMTIEARKLITVIISDKDTKPVLINGVVMAHPSMISHGWD